MGGPALPPLSPQDPASAIGGRLEPRGSSRTTSSVQRAVLSQLASATDLARAASSMSARRVAPLSVKTWVQKAAAQSQIKAASGLAEAIPAGAAQAAPRPTKGTSVSATPRPKQAPLPPNQDWHTQELERRDFVLKSREEFIAAAVDLGLQQTPPDVRDQDLVQALRNGAQSAAELLMKTMHHDARPVSALIETQLEQLKEASEDAIATPERAGAEGYLKAARDAIRTSAPDDLTPTSSDAATFKTWVQQERDQAVWNYYKTGNRPQDLLYYAGLTAGYGRILHAIERGAKINASFLSTLARVEPPSFVVNLPGVGELALLGKKPREKRLTKSTPADRAAIAHDPGKTIRERTAALNRLNLQDSLAQQEDDAIKQDEEFIKKMEPTYGGGDTYSLGLRAAAHRVASTLGIDSPPSSA